MGWDAAAEAGVGGGWEDQSLGFTRIYCSPQPRSTTPGTMGWSAGDGADKDSAQGQPSLLTVLWASQLSAAWRPPPHPCGGLPGWGKEAITS